MTQFASTLYPQTNPTNVVLLAFRERKSGDSFATDVERWRYALDSEAAFGGWTLWDHPKNVFHSLTIADPTQLDHARRVLTSLTVLSG